MSSVRVEGDAFTDERYWELAELCGLADNDHARAKMERLWWQCTQERRYVLPESSVIRVLGARGPDAIVRARLGEKVGDGIRIRGTKGRIEWLEQLRKNGRKGGRPRKPKAKPSGSKELNPPAPAPAPAPVLTPAPLSQTQTRERGPDPEKARLAERLWFEHCDRHVALGLGDRPLLKLTTANGYRELRERLEPYADLVQAEADMRHVLDVREAEAREKQTAEYFGEPMWRAANVSKALTLSAPRQEPTQSEDLPGFEQSSYRVDWRDEGEKGDAA